MEAGVETKGDNMMKWGVKPGQPEAGLVLSSAEPIRPRQTHARTLAPAGGPEPTRLVAAPV